MKLKNELEIIIQNGSLKFKTSPNLKFLTDYSLRPYGNSLSAYLSKAASPIEHTNE